MGSRIALAAILPLAFFVAMLAACGSGGGASDTGDPQARPFGPIKAEPARVSVPAGQCLQAGAVPGTEFRSESRSCLPSGHLLWLYGDSVEVDGVVWRYALGAGWVEAGSLRADPQAYDLLAGRTEPVVVSRFDGHQSQFGRIEPDGTTKRLAVVPYVPDSSVGGRREVSPDGRHFAFTVSDGGVETVITDLESGKERRFPRAYFAGWSRQGAALLVDPPGGQVLVFTPDEDEPRKFANLRTSPEQTAWFPTGDSIVAGAPQGALVRVRQGGEASPIVGPGELDGGPPSELSVSPGGERVLVVPYAGASRVITIESGETLTLSLADQAGASIRCTTSGGSHSGWIDEHTAVWHESYAGPESNGISVLDLVTGDRWTYPLIYLDDLQPLDDGLVSFTTFEVMPDRTWFPLTWVLDVRSRDARPIAVGDTARFIKG